MSLSIPEAFAIAQAQYEAGDVAGAEQICRQILEADPRSASTWNFLGVIELHRRNFGPATDYLNRALQLRPDWDYAQNNLGLVLHQQGMLHEAAAYYRRALATNPNFADAHCNLGLAFLNQGNPIEAIPHFERALTINPNYPQAHVNLGNAFKLTGDFDHSAAHYRQALAIKPDFAEAVHNLGSVLQAHGKYDESLLCYEQTVALAPTLAEAHKNLSQLRLLLGDFTRGWPEYEWRWKTGELPIPTFTQPRWTGQSLSEKTILLVAEQGFGDTLQFIRYAPLVERLGAKVLLQCPPQLIPLAKTCSGISAVFADNTSPPLFDYYIPLLSLPGILTPNLKSIPANTPYLFPNPQLIDTWRRKLEPLTGFRIGINWQGRGGQGDFRLRDLPLEMLASLADIPGVRLINLQQGEGRRQLLASPLNNVIHDLGDEVDKASGAFMDTAAIMQNLDLVVTSDTSIAHLAGALAIPVWVGLPFVPNWRWLLNRHDTPWYPTMRLFRQPQLNDWATVLADTRAALSHLVASRAASQVTPTKKIDVSHVDLREGHEH